MSKIEWDGVTFPAPDGVVVKRPKVAEAIGVATGHEARFENGEQSVHFHHAVQHTMLAEAHRAIGEGVNDIDSVRERMVQARDRLMGR
jgi:hypothetical protein